MVINTNISSLNSARLLNQSSTALTKSLARLSSGSRIVSPEDDAAGLAQSVKFAAQISRNTAANVNVQNAVSYSQTQDGFLQKTQKALDRMSELSVLAQDTTKTNSDLSNYAAEFTQLQSYISDITGKQFNGVSLFASSALAITVDSDAVTFGMNAADLAGATSTGVLNAYSGVSISTSTAAYSALNQIKTAIQALANMRAQIGANIQRLSLTGEQLSVLNENLSAANSRIADVDVAQESTEFARLNILVQSGTSMLAQANARPQLALQLLR
ncbi:MAG: flagellin [Verrucomicrobia bacterium]|nr:flagellin [Verrucomicrobiota bacterium]